MRAAAYARYSSDLQSEKSAEDQIAFIRREAGRFGCTVEATFKDDALSGAVADRPGYQAMLAAAKRRDFEAIIVEHQDRLWRDQEEMYAALKRLRFASIKVFSVAMGELTGDTGKMVATVAGLQAEMYLDDLKQKTRRGMAGQISRGFAVGGPAYGYRLDASGRDDKHANARLVIYEPEARIVRRALEEFASGASCKTITRRLTAERIPPPRGRVEDGWNPATIHGVKSRGTGFLNNELYRGVMIWGKTEKVRHPDTGQRVPRRRDRSEWVRVEMPELRIIPENLWLKGKARQAEITRRTGGGRYNPTRHLFSGLLKCPACGSNYTMRDKTFYACARNRARGTCSNGHAVRRAVLEERLLQAIEEQILSPANVAHLTRKVEEVLSRAARTSTRRQGDAELRKAERERDNVIDAVKRGKATDTLLRVLEETEERIRRLRAEMQTEPKGKAAIRALPGLVERYARDLRSVLGRDVERARAMLARLLGEIVLRPDGQGLVAELQGNVTAAVGFETTGAGRGI